jgi:hypothetical protein
VAEISVGWGGGDAIAPPPPLFGKLTEFWPKRGLKTAFSSANGEVCRKFESFVGNLYVATVSKFAEICSTSHFQDYFPYKFWAFTQKIRLFCTWRAVYLAVACGKLCPWDIPKELVITRRQISLFSTRKVLSLTVNIGMMFCVRSLVKLMSSINMNISNF